MIKKLMQEKKKNKKFQAGQLFELWCMATGMLGKKEAGMHLEIRKGAV